jgi:hypothetical protein
MSWSLRVSNGNDGTVAGDLVLDGQHFGTVINEAKLVQDLRHFILSRMGDDALHPSYGSLLDGGVTPDGRVRESVIGQMNSRLMQLEIESEIRRIARVYQNMQVDRAKRDRARYNKSTLTGGEILAAVTNVSFKPVADSLTVIVTIQSARGGEANLNLDLAPVITTT